MDANILGNVGVGLAQGLERGVQNAYQINRQGMMDRLSIQKMAEESKARQVTMSTQELQMQQMKIQLEQLQKNKLKETAYNATNAFFEDGNYRHINNALQETPELKQLFKGVTRVDPLDMNNEADKRMFEELGGVNYDSPEARKRYVKATNPDGTIMIADMFSMAKGNGTWKTWNDEQLSKREKEADIAYKTASTLKAEAEAGYYSSKGSSEGGEQFYKTAKAKKEYTDAMIEEVAISNPEAVGTAVLSDETEVDFNGAVMPVAKVAKAAQGKNDMSATDRQYLDGLYDASTSFKAIKTKLEDDKIDRNALKKAWSEIASISGAEMAKMTPADREQFLNKLSLDSETRLAAAAFIKAMSGAAVSDQERAYYLDLITKGDWSTKEASLATIEGFRTGLNRSYENKLDSLKNFVPYDVYTRRGQRKNLIGEQPKQEVKRDTKGIPLPSKQNVESVNDKSYMAPPPPSEVVNAIEPGEVVAYQGKQGKVLKNVGGIITLEFEDGTTANLKAPK